MPDIAICVATRLEQADLADSGAIAGVTFEVVRTGVGPVNAAIALTRFLASNPTRLVISCGIGGAYPESGLQPESVACAETEIYADLGAESPDGFLDMEAIGFPVVKEHYNLLPLDRFPAPTRVPFVTRTTCTGNLESALEVVKRTAGAVESMEGAAIVHTALAHGLPVGEIRGISNPIGNRDRAAWRLHEAAHAAVEILSGWIEEAGARG